jgi:hypothetical protein
MLANEVKGFLIQIPAATVLRNTKQQQVTRYHSFIGRKGCKKNGNN